jgi:hypothetical protein
MIGKKVSNGWKTRADFSNDWKNFSAVFQRLEKIFAEGKREDFQSQRRQRAQRKESGRETGGGNLHGSLENRFVDSGICRGAGGPPARLLKSRKQAPPMFSIYPRQAARPEAAPPEVTRCLRKTFRVKAARKKGIAIGSIVEPDCELHDGPGFAVELLLTFQREPE